MTPPTSQPYQQPVAGYAAYRRLRRAWLVWLAVCIVLAPLLLVLGFALDPTGGTPHRDVTTIAVFQAANPLQLQAFLLVNVLTPYVYPLSCLGLGLLALRRVPWLATLGTVYALVGALPFPLFVGQESLAHEIAQMPHSAAHVSVLQGLSNEWPVVFLRLSWVLGHLLGYILLGLALWRARVIPLWAASFFIVSVPLIMLAYGSNQGICQVIGTALTFVASLPAARAMLKRSDDEAPDRVSEEPASAS